MLGSARSRDRDRRAFVLALVAFLSVTVAVCGGVYRLYQQGALSAVLESNGRRAILLATSTPTPTEAPPTVLPTITARAASAGAVPTSAPTAPPASATPAPSATPSLVPTPRPTDTLTPTPDPLAGTFSVDYVGCSTPGGSTFKGRVYDRGGNIIVGAQVYVTLDDWLYDVPAVSNDAGWYELYLTNGQNVRVVRLIIAGEEQVLAEPGPAAVPVLPDCFQEANLQQH